MIQCSMGRPFKETSIRLALLFAASACDGPRLNLTVDLPEAFVSEVVVVQLRLLVLPTAATFDCEAVAFGEVSEQTLGLSLERQFRVTPGDGFPLMNVDRVADKILLADGLDIDGRPVARGCLEIGEVEDDAERVLDMEPIARLVLSGGSTLAVSLGDTEELTLNASLRDLLDRMVAEVPIRWRVAASGVRPSEGTVRTRADGAAMFSVQAPGRPGPYLIELRARWSPDRRVLSGFVRPPPEVATLSGRARAHRSGRIGPEGEPGFVSLLEAGADVVRVAQVYRDSMGSLVEVTSEPIRGPDSILGLVHRPNETADRAIVLNEEGWWEIQPDGQAAERSGFQSLGRTPRRVLSFNPCGGGEPELAVVYGSEVVFHAASGSPRTGFRQPLNVIAAGCTANRQGGEVRTLVVVENDMDLLLLAELEPARFIVRPWIALPQGINFATSIGGSSRLLIGTQLSVNDFVVSQASVRVTGTRFELVTERTDSPPELPLTTLSGDFDGDLRLDIASLYRRFSPEPTPQPFGLWVVFGATDRGRRLSGDALLTGGPGATAFEDPVLLAVDLDVDGLDDLVVLERTGRTPADRSSQVVVYSMGASN